MAVIPVLTFVVSITTFVASLAFGIVVIIQNCCSSGTKTDTELLVTNLKAIGKAQNVAWEDAK
jgi:hypothetical protein